jgi:MFS transporter, ACS family, solute carrier family 17 (sodium-dependent inorganic phosphate cotransporter), other
MGTIIAYVLSPIIIDTFNGWRSLFFVYGGAGLLMIIPWLLLAKDKPVPQQQQLTIVESSEQEVSTTLNSMYESSSKIIETSHFWDKSQSISIDAPWVEMIQSKGVWAMLLAHCARNWGLYNTLSWTPTFYAEEYGIGVRESAILSVLPSVAGAVGGFVAGFSADWILRNMRQKQRQSNSVSNSSNQLKTFDIITTRERDENDKTNIRKVFQGISLLGSATSLGVLALHIPEEAWVAQIFLTASLGLLSFSAAGFDAATQDKAGEKWAGLLYSVTSLPAVMCK